MPDKPVIFISYRRRDAGGHGRALYDYLSGRFNEDRIFFDRSTIESGDVFPDTLRRGVEGCAALLALIGPEWLDVRGDDGGRRLDDAEDFVRREIALALEQGKKVIPVLFDDAPVPPRARLPDPIKALASCDALTLRGKTYEYQTQRRELVRLLAKVPGVPQPFPEAKELAQADSNHNQMLAEVRRLLVEETSAFHQQHPRACYPRLKRADTYALDWGTQPDVALFQGRTEELGKLERWILDERCHTVAILGMGGIGKTALAARLAEHLRGHFEYIIWLSLLHGPPLTDLLAHIIKALSDQQDTKFAPSIDRLIVHLRERRCLLIIDNVERILSPGLVGQYIHGYENYGELFKQIGGVRHKSCLLLTSREQPSGVEPGDKLPVRALYLRGLNTDDGKRIFSYFGTFVASDEEWQAVIEHYVGNPQALRIVAPAALATFGGNLYQLTQCFKRGEFVFEEMSDLLNRQFNRLSELEKTIMYWLAINREPISTVQLEADIYPKAPKKELLNAIYSLIKRSLVDQEKLTTSYGVALSLHPVVLEYITDLIKEQVVSEVCDGKAALLRNYALIKAMAKDFIRHSQIQFLAAHICEELLTTLGSKAKVEEQLAKVLAWLREQPDKQQGYAVGNALNLLTYMDADLRNYDLSNMAIWQAYLADTDLRYMNFSSSDIRDSVFNETFGSILSVAFSQDGELFANGDTLNEVRVWRASDEKPLLVCRAHVDWVRSVAFSPGCLASGSADHTIRLWDTRTGECIKTLRGHSGRVWSVAFSSDGQMLASASQDRTVRLWDIRAGTLLKVLKGHKGWIQSVAFSPSGQYIASGGADEIIRLWNAKTGKCLRVLNGHEGWIQSVVFSPDEQSIISGSNDKTVRVWNSWTGQCLKVLYGHSDRIQCIAISPDGETVASGSEDGTARIWNLNTGKCIKILQGHTNRIRTVAFSPTGQSLISGSDDQTVRVWEVDTGRCLKRLRGGTNRPWSVTFSPDGQRLASGYEDNRIRIWDVNSGQCIGTLHKHTNWVRSVAFSPDGHVVVSGGDDQTVRLWSVDTGQCRSLSGHSDKVRSVAFSPDGHVVASGGDDQTVRLWDIKNAECLRVLVGHDNWVRSVAFSPDGHVVASGSTDHTVRIWDTKTGKCLRVLVGHDNWVRSVAFSPDGHVVASGSADETIKIWNVRTGKCVNTLKQVKPQAYTHSSETSVFCGYTNIVLSIAFTHTGAILASGSADQIIRLWDISTGDCFRILRAERVYEGMNITGTTGLTDGQKENLKALGAIESGTGPEQGILIKAG